MSCSTCCRQLVITGTTCCCQLVITGTTCCGQLVITGTTCCCQLVITGTTGCVSWRIQCQMGWLFWNVLWLLKISSPIVGGLFDFTYIKIQCHTRTYFLSSSTFAKILYTTDYKLETQKLLFEKYFPWIVSVVREDFYEYFYINISWPLAINYPTCSTQPNSFHLYLLHYN